MTAIFSLNNISPQDDLIWRHNKDIGLPSDNFKVNYTPDDETIFEYWMVPPPPTSIWEEQSIFSMCDDPSIFSIDENDVCQGFVNQQFQKNVPMRRITTTIISYCMDYSSPKSSTQEEKIPFSELHTNTWPFLNSNKT